MLSSSMRVYIRLCLDHGLVRNFLSVLVILKSFLNDLRLHAIFLYMGLTLIGSVWIMDFLVDFGGKRDEANIFLLFLLHFFFLLHKSKIPIQPN